GVSTTTAWSASPPIHLIGIARTPQMAERLMAVIKTIRFPVPERNGALVALVDSFFERPFRTDLPRTIMESAISRADVKVDLTTTVLPWTCYADTSTVIKTLDGVLTIAYIAGNMLGQLHTGQRGDQPKDGILGVFLAYNAIQSRVKEYKVPELEQWRN